MSRKNHSKSLKKSISAVSQQLFRCMDIPDAVLGKLLLGVTTCLFLVFIFLINTYPFIDEGETGFYLANISFARLLLAHNID